MGSLGEPPVASQQDQSSRPDNAMLKNALLDAANGRGARILFQFALCEQTTVQWEAVLYKRCLYLRPGDGTTLPDGSKEAFVALLEYTEEFLQCSHIIVCFKKDSVDRAALVRTFMFLGFVVVHPNHPLSPRGNFLSLLYTVEDDYFDDDDDDDD